MSSPRQEYRPWTGVRPAKSARRNPPAQYSSPGTDATHVLRETSYQAAYSGEAQRATGPLQGENIIPSASTHIQPAAIPQPLPAVMQAGGSTSSPGLQQGVHNERSELCAATKGEVSGAVHHRQADGEPIRERCWVHVKAAARSSSSSLISAEKSDLLFGPSAAQSDPAV